MNSPLEILKKYWGFDEFRSLQKEVIDSVLSKKDTIALLHTGAGKSLCYQLPALIFEGKTIVISPLIALMQDQVNGLVARGVNAKAIYAGMTKREVDITIDNFVHGPIKILYVSPERTTTDIFIERFKRADIALIAVDEAHCISQWGYDFRPSYLTIADLRKWKPDVPIIAVTATATQHVVEDIADKLTLQDHELVTSTFARENISLSVIMTESKEKMLLDILNKMKGVGIIYLRSRKRVKELTEWLGKRNIKASYYHGGLGMKTRQRIQNEWQHSSNGLIICTNAFGMGVDKSDVRYVIHLDVPPSVEEYYQEAGRAGRDGKPAYAISIIGHGDLVKLEYNVSISYPPMEEIGMIYQKLCSYLKVAYGSGEMESYTFNFDGFTDRYSLNRSKVYSVLNLLEKEGWLQFNEGYRNPSTVLITSNKKSITLSSRNRDLKSKILMYLVRRYEGLFIDHISIDEIQMAESLGIKSGSVVTELNVMAREAILDYKPSKEGARVTFLLPRPEPKSFKIDAKMYNFRAERANERKTSIIDYVLSDTCRQQIILNYFDEESGSCGRCDICKGSNDTKFSKEEKYKLRDHISKYLLSNRVRLGDYLQMWPYNKRAKAKACILALENEGFLAISDDDEISLSKRKN